MRWLKRTIPLLFCGLIILGAASAQASVTLKISASNPSSFEAREIPLKSYLPKGIQPEHVIDAGGLEIGYDVKRDQAYVHQDLMLEAQASASFNVEIEDIWLIEEEELAKLSGQASALAAQLAESQYAAIAGQVQKNIEEKATGILRRQEESLVYKVGPPEHISAFETNRETIAVIQGNINDLTRMVEAFKEEKKVSGGDQQTLAAKLLQAQSIKEQILNFGTEGVENSCLVEEALKIERENILLESPETVTMQIEFENPSTTKRQVVPLRFYLAREVDASDVINPEGLKVGFDFEKSLYYVYNDSVALDPGETKTFQVILNNKWAIDKAKLYGLKVYLENLTRSAEEAIGLGAAQEYGKQTLNDIYGLLRQADPAELTENRVVAFRGDLAKVENLRQSVQRMEDFLVEGKISPEITIMEQELLCRDARLVEHGSKDTLGLAGILQSRRVKLLAGSIFKGKNLSTADTWDIIWYIILFLGVMSGVFYYVNIRQQKSVMFDPLTGAFARGYALERFREELRVAKGANNRCSLLVMDIDKFKRINDTHGHAVGDTILKEFVIAIRKGVRATDLVGRFGGDEFIIILPTGEKAIGLKIAQGIARIVEGTAIKVSPQLTLNITTSIGVASFPQDSGTAEDLFDKADQALYEVKKRGGNGAEPFGGQV